METTDFAEIADEFERRVREKVWCIVATVDRGSRPRSRVLHPVWEGTTGWIGTYPGSHKARHLAANPFVSCGYADPVRPLYVDCLAEWVDDPAVREHAWEYIKAQPEPYGFDPVAIWPGPQDASFGLLKLAPWRIQLTTAEPGAPPLTQVWRPPSD